MVDLSKSNMFANICAMLRFADTQKWYSGITAKLKTETLLNSNAL